MSPRHKIVAGGNLLDVDLGIYVVDHFWPSKILRKLGHSTCLTSFYNSDDSGCHWAVGSIIDMNDRSGLEFVHSIFNNPPGLLEYKDNAGNYQKYDFKHRGAENIKDDRERNIYYYRGMVIGTSKINGVREPLITSARDIGNLVAGYMTGYYGISWKRTRKEFDKYQGSTEGYSSQNAQYYGWLIGHSTRAPFVYIELALEAFKRLLGD